MDVNNPKKCFVYFVLIYFLSFFTFSLVNDEMFTAVNGDRPNPPYGNTVVLLSDGRSQTPFINVDWFDRKIAIGFGNVDANLVNFASSPDDYTEIMDTCALKNFLKKRLLCEETVATNGTDCGPMTSLFQDTTPSAK